MVKYGYLVPVTSFQWPKEYDGVDIYYGHGGIGRKWVGGVDEIFFGSVRESTNNYESFSRTNL